MAHWKSTKKPPPNIDRVPDPLIHPNPIINHPIISVATAEQRPSVPPRPLPFRSIEQIVWEQLEQERINHPVCQHRTPLPHNPLRVQCNKRKENPPIFQQYTHSCNRWLTITIRTGLQTTQINVWTPETAPNNNNKFEVQTYTTYVTPSEQEFSI
jgi:hypothetical protein